MRDLVRIIYCMDTLEARSVHDRRCIIHFGTHKTGTTSIQSFLGRNRELLRQNGYAYPVMGKKGVDHNQLAHRLAVASDCELYSIRQELMEALRVEDDACSCLVLSSEALSTRISNRNAWVGFADGFYWDNRRRYLEKLKQVLTGFDDIEAFLIFRDHEEYAHSLYSTKILGGKISSSFRDFVNSCGPIFDYRNQVETVRSVFRNLNVEAYDSATSSLETQFLSRLKVPADSVSERRLNRTPNLIWVKWIADSAATEGAVSERRLRIKFSRDERHQSLVEGVKVESLWTCEDERAEFLRMCSQVPGLVLPARAGSRKPSEGPDVRECIRRLDDAFSRWKRRGWKKVLGFRSPGRR